MDKQSDRLIWVDSLKGIAVCGVIMIHSGGSNLPSLIGNIGSIGNSGVQLFFLLTGFLCFLSYANNKTGSGKKWLINKLVRLIPLYYLAIIIYTIFTGGSEYWLGAERGITIGNILAHITFLNAFFPHYLNSILGVEWYIATLAVLYVLVPILYKRIDTLEKSVLWFIASIIPSKLLCWLFNYFIRNANDSYIYSSYFCTFWIVAQLPVILLGIVLFYLCKSDMVKQIKNKKFLSYILLFFSGTMIGGMAFEENSLLLCTNITIFGVWFFFLSCSQYLHQCILIDNPVFRALGKYSYGIYLFHFIFINYYDKYVPVLLQNVILNWLIKYVVIILLSLLISILLTRWIEKPILKKLLNK